ncbi:hypothetical protein Tco_0650367 [Tanacetum coccineum]
MKRHIEIVKDDEVVIDAIPLATKPPMIVEYKIDKDERMGYFKLIRVDISSKRPEEDYERVLWGDLKVMFEPDIKSEIWRNLQGYKVTIWKLFDTFNAACAQLQLLSDYYYWKNYVDREGIKIDWRTRILTKITGWAKGLADRSDEDIMNALSRVENFNAYFDKKMYVEYDKLFTKRCPFVEKISHGFCHLVSDLLKIYPDPPPSGQAPTTTARVSTKTSIPSGKAQASSALKKT